MDVMLIMLSMAWGAEKLGTKTVAAIGIGTGIAIFSFLAGLLIYALLTAQSPVTW